MKYYFKVSKSIKRKNNKKLKVIFKEKLKIKIQEFHSKYANLRILYLQK